jgi:hypothetical protein
MFSFWFLDKGRFVFLSHVKEREAAATVETLAAAAICLVLAVYDRKSTGPRLLYLPLRWAEEVGISELCSKSEYFYI